MTHGGPLEEAFGGRPSSNAACVPLGPDGALAGQVALVSFLPGRLPQGVQIESVQAEVPDGVAFDWYVVREPADVYAPLTSMSQAPHAEIAEVHDVERRGATFVADDDGVLLSGEVAFDTPPEPGTIERVTVTGITYASEGRLYRFGLDVEIHAAAMTRQQVIDIDCLPGEEVQRVDGDVIERDFASVSQSDG